jgi:RNA 2',3'-cyclic 3'-phosphodiesterase
MQPLPVKIRAFIAVRLSDEIEAALTEFVDTLRTPRDGVRWVRRQNLHVTLKFLGPAVDSQMIPPLADALHALAAATAPLELRARGVGGFPELARPRVIWVGLESAELAALCAQIDEAAGRCGFERETRPFAGHLTIGRVRDWRSYRAVRARLEAARERDFGASRIDSMTLYRSTLAQNGSIYDPLATFVFRGARATT